MFKAVYKNPWHNPLDKYSGPEFFSTDARPEDYKGYKIYRRLKDVFDVVKDSVCVTQMAGINGAKRAIDQLIGKKKGGIQ